MTYDNTVETITINEAVRVRIVPDDDPMSPKEWDNVGEIAYLASSRYVLGTEDVSSDRMDEIRAGIADGTLVGLPVFAYVHGGATIRCGERGGYPFDCPWDAGQSGYVYCTKEKALKECVTIEGAEKCLRGEVEAYDQYLRGDVYGWIVETLDPDDDEAEWENEDSCWGFYGIDYAVKEGRSAGEYAAKQHEEEAQRTKRELEAHMAGL